MLFLIWDILSTIGMITAIIMIPMMLFGFGINRLQKFLNKYPTISKILGALVIIGIIRAQLSRSGGI